MRAGPLPPVCAEDGIEIRSKQWVSDPVGARLLFVHATGFCKEIFDPLADELSGLAGFEATGLDLRAHGDSQAPASPIDWWDFGRDVLAVLDGQSDTVGVGHSAGGAALVLAEILSPGSFHGLVLVEPILFPPPYRREEDQPLAVAARKRRSWFASRAEAIDRWRSRPAFRDWQHRSLQAYADGGLRPADGGYRLKCDPRDEADTFAAATAHGGWSRLDEVTCPVMIVTGSGSATHQEPYLSRLAARFGDVRVEVIEGTSHFVPMETPEKLAATIAASSVPSDPPR